MRNWFIVEERHTQPLSTGFTNTYCKASLLNFTELSYCLIMNVWSSLVVQSYNWARYHGNRCYMTRKMVIIPTLFHAAL